MDNKQKKKLYKLIYVTLFMFVLAVSAMGVYLSVQNIVNNNFLYINYIVIALYFLADICFIVDFYKTDKIENKYNVAKMLFVILALTGILAIALFVTFYIKGLTLSNLTFLPILMLFISEFLSSVAFVLGLKLSKLYSNTTITIDSTSETPNFDDELILKKKLDELNRKLEIKKVQDEINKIQKELDE